MTIVQLTGGRIDGGEFEYRQGYRFESSDLTIAANTVTVGTRGILTNTSATPSVIKCASLNSSDGTYNHANIQLITEGTGTIKMAAAHKVNELVVRDSARTTLLSNITVANELVTAGELIAGSYSITHETPTERYSAPMRYPIVRCPKRNPISTNRFTRNFERDVI